MPFSWREAEQHDWSCRQEEENVTGKKEPEEDVPFKDGDPKLYHLPASVQCLDPSVG